MFGELREPMKRQLIGPVCLFVLTGLPLVAEEPARGRLDDFTTPILQTAGGDRAGSANLSGLTSSRSFPQMSLAPATSGTPLLGTEFSSGGGSLIYSGSPITEKLMGQIRADWKAQDARRLERERRAEQPVTRAMYYVFPEEQSYSVGHTKMGGGLINAVKQRNPFCLLDQVFFLWSF